MGGSGVRLIWVSLERAVGDDGDWIRMDAWRKSRVRHW
jgi:hypothetical protein